MIDSIAYIVFFFPSLIALGIVGYIAAKYAWDITETSEQTPWRPHPVAVQVHCACGLLAADRPGLLGAPEEPLHGAYRRRARAQGEGRGMTGEALVGLIMLLALLGAIFIGVPISFTLLFLAFTFGYFALGATVFDLAYFGTIGQMKEQLLAAVPLFIFMGFITEQAGLMERLFRAFRLLLAPIRGALYLVVILTATVFAMATGIVGAAVTVLGIMAAPIMIKSGYDARLSAGAITAGGTLGILIPPSVMLIVMGPVLGVSVADLYAAAFGPGFLLAGIYLVYLMGRSIINPKLGPPVPKEERREAFAAMSQEVVPIARWRSEWFPCWHALPSPPICSAMLRWSRRWSWHAAGSHRRYRRALLGAGPRSRLLPVCDLSQRGHRRRPLVGLIAATLGSILAGLATPTEAAGIGAPAPCCWRWPTAGSARPRSGVSMAGMAVALAGRSAFRQHVVSLNGANPVSCCCRRGRCAGDVQQLPLERPAARPQLHHVDVQHGAAAGGDLQHLRRGVRPARLGRLDYPEHAVVPAVADADADAGAGADLPAGLAVRVAGDHPGVPADLLSGDGRPRRRWSKR